MKETAARSRAVPPLGFTGNTCDFTPWIQWDQLSAYTGRYGQTRESLEFHRTCRDPRKNPCLHDPSQLVQKTLGLELSHTISTTVTTAICCVVAAQRLTSATAYSEM